MKLDFKEIKIERSADFKSQNFGIGNTRIILEILRGKIYSNPIQTICQEYSSNARDAHREIGKNSIPIEIKLPNRLDPSFWIRDFGPGITPERMAEVFILYGESTKRGDNTQGGGFGIGSKSAFSYADSFTIVSITLENNTLIRREYIAHIDESGLGQISCVKEEVTNDPQGTTIIISPKESDWANFAFYTKRATTHWPVRPIILGDTSFVWPAYKVAYKGEDWELHENQLGLTANVVEQVPYGLIDGIPYILNMRHLYPNGYSLIANIPLRLHFKIGEVPVTANREEIDYQASTITYVKARIDKTIKELQDQLTSNLVNVKSLRAAVLMWHDLVRKVYKGLLTQTTWKDIVLSKFESIRLDNQDLVISHFRRDNSAIFGCRKSSDGNSIQVNSITICVEDDLKVKGIQRSRLATIFDKYPNITHVQVVDFSKKIERTTLATGEIINKISITDDATMDKRKKEVEKIAHWSLLEPILLSSMPKKEIVLGTSPGKKYKIIKIKRLIGTSESNCDWAEADPEILEDKKPKLYVTLSNRLVLWKNDQKIQTASLYRILNGIKQMRASLDPKDTEDLKVYGIIPSLATKLENDWKPLCNYLETIMETYKKTLPTQFGSEFALSRLFNHYLTTFLTSSKVTSALKENSLLKKYINISHKMNDSATKVGLYNDIAGSFNQLCLTHKSENQKEIKELHTKVMAKYPLLFSINGYHGMTNLEDDILLYIKTKDAEKEAEKGLDLDKTI